MSGGTALKLGHAARLWVFPPGALPAQPWPQATVTSCSGPINAVLTAMCSHGAALATLPVSRKDAVAADSSANLTEHYAEPRGRSVRPLCCQGMLLVAFYS